MPQLGQGELTAQLKSLIVDVLAGWDTGLPLPRLCYVTDAGENETRFYRKVLLNLRDPRCRRRRLKWYRIIDYYHAAERITAMSECLFRKDSVEGKSWARKMRKLLLKPGGASRVLHSAAALLKHSNVHRFVVSFLTSPLTTRSSGQMRFGGACGSVRCSCQSSHQTG